MILTQTVMQGHVAQQRYEQIGHWAAATVKGLWASLAIGLLPSAAWSHGGEV